MRRVRSFALSVFLLALVCPSSARASTISFPALTDPGSVTFTGTFTQDNDVALFSFVLTTDATFYGSTNDGPGGLDSLLTLLGVAADGSMSWILENDDSPLGGTDSLLTDAITGLPGVFLTAGSYALALTQTYNHFNPGTGGFDQDDSPLYTCDPYGTGTPDPACVDAGGFMPLGVQTGTAFELTFGATPPGTPAPVPEPGTLGLLGTGVATMLARARRRRKY